jgi:hypothetical protein
MLATPLRRAADHDGRRRPPVCLLMPTQDALLRRSLPTLPRAQLPGIPSAAPQSMAPPEAVDSRRTAGIVSARGRSFWYSSSRSVPRAGWPTWCQYPSRLAPFSCRTTAGRQRLAFGAAPWRADRGNWKPLPSEGQVSGAMETNGGVCNYQSSRAGLCRSPKAATVNVGLLPMLSLSASSAAKA